MQRAPTSARPQERTLCAHTHIRSSGKHLLQNIQRSWEESSQHRVILARFPEDEHSPQRSIPKSPQPGPTSRTMLYMGRALHLFTAPPMHPAGGLRRSPHASQLCSCRRCQTCRTRPEAPYQSRTRITDAHPPSLIQRCPPTQTAASCHRPARISLTGQVLAPSPPTSQTARRARPPPHHRPSRLDHNFSSVKKRAAAGTLPTRAEPAPSVISGTQRLRAYWTQTQTGQNSFFKNEYFN
jgi:hypothetical protein